MNSLRIDRYGGALGNRLRFLREVTAAVIAEAGAGRAPPTTLQGAVDDTPEATYPAAARARSPRRGVHSYCGSGLGRRATDGGGIQGGAAHRRFRRNDLFGALQRRERTPTIPPSRERRFSG
jgi:hypothetical protein